MSLGIRAPDPDVLPAELTARIRLLLGYRTLGFATALFTTAAFPLALPFLGAAPSVSCFAHWCYGVGEFLALLGVLTMGVRRYPVTTAVHVILTVVWTVLVSLDCTLWTGIWAAAGLPAVARPMAM